MIGSLRCVLNNNFNLSIVKRDLSGLIFFCISNASDEPGTSKFEFIGTFLPPTDRARDVRERERLEGEREVREKELERETERERGYLQFLN